MAKIRCKWGPAAQELPLGYTLSTAEENALAFLGEGLKTKIVAAGEKHSIIIEILLALVTATPATRTKVLDRQDYRVVFTHQGNSRSGLTELEFWKE